jgi:hypothetical protein
MLRNDRDGDSVDSDANTDADTRERASGRHN